MLRGEIYQAILDPTIDSEQSGTKPVLIVSRKITVNAKKIIKYACVAIAYYGLIQILSS